MGNTYVYIAKSSVKYNNNNNKNVHSIGKELLEKTECDK